MSARLRPSSQPPGSAVLITGASGGIGRAVGLACAAAGWFVGVHYHENKPAADETLRHVHAAGAHGSLYEADIRISQAVRHMVEAFCRDAPQATMFVCNAGIAGSSFVLREREDVWANIIATNLTGTFHCLRAMAPFLSVHGGGSIVVIGSYAGFHGSTGQAAYAASKAGLIGLVKTAALEWGPNNVRINLLLPGRQDTELSQGVFPSQTGWNDHALHRPPAIDEVARTVVHMARSTDVSGQIWNCDSRHV